MEQNPAHQTTRTTTVHVQRVWRQANNTGFDFLERNGIGHMYDTVGNGKESMTGGDTIVQDTYKATSYSDARKQPAQK